MKRRPFPARNFDEGASWNSGGGGSQKFGVLLRRKKHGFSWLNRVFGKLKKCPKGVKIRHILGHIRHLDGLDAFRSWGH